MGLLNESQRREVFTKVLQTVDKKFMGPDADTKRLREEHEHATIYSETVEDEHAMNRMLRQLGASHTGFFHESKPRAAGRIAIVATLQKADTADGHRWVFQDVHPGGVAAHAGIRPGDVLLTVDEKDLVPPQAIPFMLGQTYTFTVRRADGSTVRPTLTIPGSKEKQRPIVVPDQVVNASKLNSDVGLIRVSMFPCILGMDVARDMSRRGRRDHTRIPPLRINAAGFGVTEANWRDAGKKDPNFLESESPLYVGRAVAALASDPQFLEQTGQLLSSWVVARRYGFTDYDGRRPDWGSHAIDWSVLPPPLVELFRTGTALQLAWLSTLADRTRRFLDKMPRM